MRWQKERFVCPVCGFEDTPAPATKPTLREPVRCRDCRKAGMLECPLVRIEKQQMIFINHDPDWFCADAEPKEGEG